MVFWGHHVGHLREWIELFTIGWELAVSGLSAQIGGQCSTSTSGLCLTILGLPGGMRCRSAQKLRAAVFSLRRVIGATKNGTRRGNRRLRG
jgi:hypothetical protein